MIDDTTFIDFDILDYPVNDIEEIFLEGISIYSHSPKSKVSNAYSNLTQEVLSNEK